MRIVVVHSGVHDYLWAVNWAVHAEKGKCSVMTDCTEPTVPEWNRILTTLPLGVLTQDSREAIEQRAAADTVLPPVNTHRRATLTAETSDRTVTITPGSVLVYDHAPKLVLDIVGDAAVLFSLTHGSYTLTYHDWVAEDLSEETLFQVCEVPLDQGE